MYAQICTHFSRPILGVHVKLVNGGAWILAQKRMDTPFHQSTSKSKRYPLVQSSHANATGVETFRRFC